MSQVSSFDPAGEPKPADPGARLEFNGDNAFHRELRRRPAHALALRLDRGPAWGTPQGMVVIVLLLSLWRR